MTGEPANSEERMWANKAEASRLEALSQVQATAEKWAGSVATLTSLFSIVALIKGREDINELSSWPKLFVGIMLLITLISAFMATFKAALASQGIPELYPAKDSPYNNPNDFRDKYVEQTQKAVKLLHCSRLWVIPAFVCLSLAIGMTWFWPVEETIPKGPNILVIQTSGTVLCGELISTSVGQVVLKQAPNEFLVTLENVAALNVIESCPASSQ